MQLSVYPIQENAKRVKQYPHLGIQVVNTEYKNILRKAEEYPNLGTNCESSKLLSHFLKVWYISLEQDESYARHTWRPRPPTSTLKQRKP